MVALIWWGGVARVGDHDVIPCTQSIRQFRCAGDARDPVVSYVGFGGVGFVVGHAFAFR